MIYIILDIYTEYTESRHPKTAIPSFSGGEGRGSERCFRCILAIILLFVLPFPTVSGQKKSDIGIIGGTSYYLGDVNHTMHLNSLLPAGGLIFRYNFNPRNSVRFNAVYARLKGDPADFQDPYPGSPHQAFTSNLLDIGIATEFNFMPYEATKLRKDRFTPYVGGGLAYMVYFGGESTAALSFGGGVKYNLTRRMSAGAEWSFRKTFTDMLDNAANIGETNNPFFHNKDWYSIVGIFVTYKIFDWGLDCAAYE
jgi:hypothetical protein